MMRLPSSSCFLATAFAAFGLNAVPLQGALTSASPPARLAEAADSTLDGLLFSTVAPGLGTNLTFAWSGLTNPPTNLPDDNPPPVLLEPYALVLGPNGQPAAAPQLLPQTNGFDTRTLALPGDRVLVVATDWFGDDHYRIELRFQSLHTTNGVTVDPDPVLPTPEDEVATVFIDATLVGSNAVAVVWSRSGTQAGLFTRVFSFDGAPLGPVINLPLSQDHLAYLESSRHLVKSARPGEIAILFPAIDVSSTGGPDPDPIYTPTGFEIRTFLFDGTATSSLTLSNAAFVIDRAAVLDSGHIVTTGIQPSQNDSREVVLVQILASDGSTLPDQRPFPVHQPVATNALGEVHLVGAQFPQDVRALGNARFAVLWLEEGFEGPEVETCPDPATPPDDEDDNDSPGDDQPGDDDSGDDSSPSTDDRDDDGSDNDGSTGSDDDGSPDEGDGSTDDGDDGSDPAWSGPYTAPVFRVFSLDGPISSAVVAKGNAPADVWPFWANLSVLSPERLALTSIVRTEPGRFAADVQLFTVDGFVELDIPVTTLRAKHRGNTVRLAGKLRWNAKRTRLLPGTLRMQHGIVRNTDDCDIDDDEIEWSESDLRLAKRTDKRGQLRFKARHRVSGPAPTFAAITFSNEDGFQRAAAEPTLVRIRSRKR